jgi:hypothetical protein
VRLGYRLVGQGQLDGRTQELTGDRFAVTGCGLVERAAVGQSARAVVEEEVRRAGGVVGAAGLLVGDQATVATAFALSNGVFARIYPLAPAPLVFAGIGFALSGASVLPRVFARTAVLISALFLIAGITAVLATAGLILTIVMSLVEAVWIAAAGIVLDRTTAHTQP